MEPSATSQTSSRTGDRGWWWARRKRAAPGPTPEHRRWPGAASGRRRACPLAPNACQPGALALCVRPMSATRSTSRVDPGGAPSRNRAGRTPGERSRRRRWPGTPGDRWLKATPTLSTSSAPLPLFTALGVPLMERGPTRPSRFSVWGAMDPSEDPEDADRPLRSHRALGRWGDGLGVQVPRPAVRSSGRAQGPPPALPEESGCRPAVQDRSGGSGEARPSSHRQRLRLPGRRGGSRHRDGAGRWRLGREAGGNLRPLRHRTRLEALRAGAGRDRLRPRPGPGPPGHQALEHPDPGRRRLRGRQGRRFRDREDRRIGPPEDRHQREARNVVLHVPRAGEESEGRGRALRHLLARRHAPAAPHGSLAVRGRERLRRHERHPDGRARPTHARRPAAPRQDRSRDPQGPPARPRPAVPDLRGVPRRPPWRGDRAARAPGGPPAPPLPPPIEPKPPEHPAPRSTQKSRSLLPGLGVALLVLLLLAGGTTAWLAYRNHEAEAAKQVAAAQAQARRAEEEAAERTRRIQAQAARSGLDKIASVSGKKSSSASARRKRPRRRDDRNESESRGACSKPVPPSRRPSAWRRTQRGWATSKRRGAGCRRRVPPSLGI